MAELDAVRLAHAAAGEQGEAGYLAIFNIGHKAEVIRVNVGGVVAGVSEADFELTR